MIKTKIRNISNFAKNIIAILVCAKSSPNLCVKYFLVQYFFVCSSILQEKASEAEDELDTPFEYLYK